MVRKFLEEVPVIFYGLGLGDLGLRGLVVWALGSATRTPTSEQQRSCSTGFLRV